MGGSKRGYGKGVKKTVDCEDGQLLFNGNHQMGDQSYQKENLNIRNILIF